MIHPERAAMSKYLNPYTDFGFKKLFGEEARSPHEAIAECGIGRDYDHSRIPLRFIRATR